MVEECWTDINFRHRGQTQVVGGGVFLFAESATRQIGKKIFDIGRFRSEKGVGQVEELSEQRQMYICHWQISGVMVRLSQIDIM